MKQVDLGPNDYRKQDPKTGRWHMPDDPKLARNYLFVLIGVLILVFLGRETLSSGILFGVVAMLAFFAGGMFALWLKDRYY